MVKFPNCKINLGLKILRKRKDGYHDLETIFYPLFPLCDALEMIPLPGSSPAGLEPAITFSGLEISGSARDNLCTRAYRLLQKDFPDLPGISVHLHKAIPMGAGLGGGSADGAFMLQLLNQQFNLGLSTEQLTTYAAALGSDCPFFILNKPCLATGRGEQLSPLPLDLDNYYFLLINPGIHLSTSWAFSRVSPTVPQKSLEQIIRQPMDTWREALRNDFEDPIATAYPEIHNLKEKLYTAGAIYAAMTGSGSTVFGIFRTPPAKLEVPAEYWQKTIKNGII